MTFEPTPTMIEAVWGALPWSPGKSDMAEAIKALFERLQDDADDARVAADVFMVKQQAVRTITTWDGETVEVHDRNKHVYRLPD